MSSVAIVGAVLATAATVANSYGEYQQEKYKSRVMKANADVMQQNAQRKRLETSINEDIARKEARRKLARNEAAMIEQGNMSPTGIGVLGEQATDLEQNILFSRYQGLAAAEAQDIEASYMRMNAKATKRQAKNKFYTDLLFTAPANGFGAYSKMGGTLGGGTTSVQPQQAYQLSDNKKYVAWSAK